MQKLCNYKTSYEHPSKIYILLWIFVSFFVFRTSLPFSSSLKVLILKIFGAKVGCGVVIKQNVNIKYPSKLVIGNNSWIGENVWIDNLDNVSIGDNCCISQGVYLLTGNHNYSKRSFDLITGEILIKDCVWIGAQSIVCPNVTVNYSSILTVGSVATSDLAEKSIYQGNPATLKKERVITK
mgnify:CR=1 FL=1